MAFDDDLAVVVTLDEERAEEGTLMEETVSPAVVEAAMAAAEMAKRVE